MKIQKLYAKPKYNLKVLLVLVFSVVITGVIAGGFSPKTYAVDILGPVCNNVNDKQPGICQDNATSSKDNPIYGPSGILTGATSVLAKAVGIVSVVGIILSGLKMITASGDPNGVSAARKALLYCVVGLAVAVVAQGIVSLVLTKL